MGSAFTYAIQTAVCQRHLMQYLVAIVRLSETIQLPQTSQNKICANNAMLLCVCVCVCVCVLLRLSRHGFISCNRKLICLL